jgi:glucan phosphoethanolaminetransferase (alkaline phosphatase superfamily)
MLRYLKIILAFAITTAVMCVLNFVAQIVLIFIDIISRWESSSALTIVLWIVTGVFGAVFTGLTATLFLPEKEITYRLTYNPVMIVSIVAIALAVALMVHGDFIEDVDDFTLFFSNGFVFVSYFIGSGGFALIGRNLDK